MTGLKSSSAAALLAAAIATAATAQQALQAPRTPDMAVDAGRIPGPVTSPQVRDSLAPYTGKSADDSFAYYGDRLITRLTPCGLQSGATYMGPDGRWYPC
jgi:hypothetical protein